jgi:ribosomal protein L29
MKIKKLFEEVLQEMTQDELDKKRKEFEQELAQVKSEYQTADSSNRARILQKMQTIKTKLNSLKMMRASDKVSFRNGDKDDDETRKAIIARRKLHVQRDGQEERRKRA